MNCPHCDRAAAYHDNLPRTLVSLFGPIRYHRAYYYCRRCGSGLCPFDQQAGITFRGLTPAVERLATLAGSVAASYEKGAELLQEMTGLRLSEATVERTTQDAGDRAGLGVAGWLPAVTSSATASRGLFWVTRPSPTSTASAPADA